MKLRAPSYPLITVDPYFSVWSPANRLTDTATEHWTASPNTIDGIVTVDGAAYRFLGKSDLPAIRQIHVDVSALVTDYLFTDDKILLYLSFYTPLLPDDLYRISRPVSYLKLRCESADGEKHDVSVQISASEELCIDKRGAEPVVTAPVVMADDSACIRMGSAAQNMLARQGDDLRIEWGWFYLDVPQGGVCSVLRRDDMTFVSAKFDMIDGEDAVVLFAYDDIKCLQYFGDNVDAYWKTSGRSIEAAICEARAEAEEILDKCREFSEELYESAELSGGEQYAELLSLAYRQVIAAHKLAVDGEGNVLFISKECFSNGCTATVDVTYPSAPLFLFYNTELLKGMLRPVFKFAMSPAWAYDFAPHDVGTYPLVNGQRYGWKQANDPVEYLKRQMPVEECGNMLVLMANIAMIDGNTSFAEPYLSVLEQWVKYLMQYGEDPEEQLCTDDFAGHMAHNCNLSLKAIMGIAGYAILLQMNGDDEGYERYMAVARKLADSWVRRAANEDGSFRLAFDQPNTFSMKYNVIWDKLWGTQLFPPCVFYSEFASNCKHINAYGMPLDSRREYTKSDWLVWTATLAPTKEEFESFIAPLWQGYNVSPSRVPMTDWYDTNTSLMVGFRNRTVQGGLFIKLLEEKFR